MNSIDLRRGGRILAPAVLIFLSACTPPESNAPVQGSTAGEKSASADVKPSETSAPSDVAAAPSTQAGDEVVDTSIRDAAGFGDNSLLEGLTPAGWRQTGEIEHYNVASLYNKIDGRSELYMAYDVVGLSWISFASEAESGVFIDVFIYDMRTPTGAFGIYSVEREPGQEKLPIGREAYRTGANIFFWKGQHYGYLQCSRANDDTKAAIVDVANKLADRLADDNSPVIGIELAPTEGMIPDTLQYFRADAMTLDFMTDTFAAKYDVNGTPVTAFMTRRGSEAEAADILKQYIGYMNEYGENVRTHTNDGVDMTVSDLGGGYLDVVFQLGNIVAGVSSVEGEENAITAAKVVHAKLKQ